MRTTVEIQDHIYERIVRDAGKRRISETINSILASHYRKKKSMFGADPWLRKSRRDDLRDEDDRDI
jgi:predicted CopG family antitoxin